MSTATHLLALACLVVPSVARASEPVDIGLGAGYSQGAGEFGGFDSTVEDTSGAGGSVQIDISRRVRPSLGLGVFGTFARYQRGDLADGDIRVFGATAGLQATYHFSPIASTAPWLSAGAGWRGMWLDPAGGTTRAFHGLELARVQLGTDVQVAPGVAISPVIGVSVSTFLGQRVGMELVGIQDRELQLTGYAGVAGHFTL